MRTGFASRNGFTRAFGAYYGISPREYAERTAVTTDGSSLRVAAARKKLMFALVLEGAAIPRESDALDRILPVTRTAPRVNDFSVLTWICRGEGWARVGDVTHQRKRGDAIWLPAGVENETGSPQGSLGLPIGTVYPDDVQFSEPLRTHFPPSWDTYLLHCSISAYTLLRPEDYDHRGILDIFGEQLAVERARVVPMPKDVGARAVASAFLQRVGTSADGTLDELPADFNEVFRRETGMTFASWQYAARMRMARELLTNGAKPSSVARRAGYTQLSNFSRAFSRFHGLPPREYQERELDTV